MGIISFNEPDLDLRCDFPARESFKESLLASLQLSNRQGVVADDGDPAEFRVLSDDELDMLAAAGDSALIYRDSIK